MENTTMVTGKPPQQVPIFFVSPGRTGSTFLARMLNDHPRILIVSDLFEPLGPNHYFNLNIKMSGKQFFKLMSRPSVKPRLQYWKVSSNTERLFYPTDDRLVSLLLCYTIPFLEPHHPMELFNKLKKEVTAFPPATPAEHTLRFFDVLRGHFHKEIWVERTGGSLPQIDKIVNTWPDAKYIYNYRDGRETAISMQRHAIFRMYYLMTKNPNLDEWDFTYYPPVEEFGKLWNNWTLLADAVFKNFDQSRLLLLPYEDLEDNLEETIVSLLNFIFNRRNTPPEDIQWVKSWLPKIKMAPTRFNTLTSVEQKKLEKVCREGLDVLGYR